MAASKHWCQIAAEMMDEEIGAATALLLVGKMQEIPNENKSLVQTLTTLRTELVKRVSLPSYRSGKDRKMMRRARRVVRRWTRIPTEGNDGKLTQLAEFIADEMEAVRNQAIHAMEPAMLDALDKMVGGG